MSEQRRTRVGELFDRALELPVDQRKDFLRRECPDDPSLVEDVWSLLAHHSKDFLEKPPGSARVFDSFREELKRPEQIGRYKILDELGSGGMGIVYLAEQQEPIKLQVALKVIPQGMATKRVLARFDTERQALALMSHNNIARVFDAGATETGSPYFVMEYVKGEPITDYCDRMRLSKRERLELFAEVCEGVQHAHQKGIIHRDIKASNVMVTTQGDTPTPKIIDFGIAKATDQRLTDATAQTEVGQIVGTYEYMSPEQAEMTPEGIDTRTDIYSLGVLLYVMLVGELPLTSQELRGASYDEFRRIVREDDPPRPSTRFTKLGSQRESVSHERSTDPHAFEKELRGDLDWIVMKALEKDRGRRYSSATEFAADIRRHLNHEPVLAGPPGAGYRMNKFVRRHRFGVAAASTILLILVMGILVTTSAMLRARAAEREADAEAETSRQVMDYLLETFKNANPEVTLREVSAADILRAGAARIESLDGQPKAKAELAKEIGRIFRARDELEDARRPLEQALTLYREIYGDDNHPDVLDALNKLGNLESFSRNYAAAVRIFEEALPMAESLHGPDNLDVALILRNLGDALVRTQNYDRARVVLERSLEIRERHGQDVGQVLSPLATVLSKTGDHEGAVPLFKRSLELRKQQFEPGHNKVGLGYIYLAQEQVKIGKDREAEGNFASALAIFRQVYRDEPHTYTSDAARGLALVLARLGEHARAVSLFQESVEIEEIKNGPDDPFLIELLRAYSKSLKAIGRAEEAADLVKRADRIARSVEQANAEAP